MKCETCNHFVVCGYRRTLVGHVLKILNPYQFTKSEEGSRKIFHEVGNLFFDDCKYYEKKEG